MLDKVQPCRARRQADGSMRNILAEVLAPGWYTDNVHRTGWRGGRCQVRTQGWHCSLHQAGAGPTPGTHASLARCATPGWRLHICKACPSYHARLLQFWSHIQASEITYPGSACAPEPGLVVDARQAGAAGMTGECYKETMLAVAEVQTAQDGCHRLNIAR